MPKLLEQLVSKIQKQGKSKSSSYAIATAALQKQGKLPTGSQKPSYRRSSGRKI